MNIFITLSNFLVPLCNTSLWPLITMDLLSVTIGRKFSRIPYELNYTVGTFCLASFAQYIVISIHSCSFLLLSGIPLYEYTTIYLFTHLLWAFELFLLCVSYKKDAIHVSVQVFVWAYAFSSLG